MASWQFMEPLVQCLASSWAATNNGSTHAPRTLHLPIHDLSEDGDDESRVVKWRDSIAAVELLALLARVDARAWAETLSRIGVKHMPVGGISVNAAASTAYALSFKGDDTSDLIQRLLDAVFLSRDKSGPYEDAKRRIIKAASPIIRHHLEGLAYPVVLAIGLMQEVQHDAVLQWFRTRSEALWRAKLVAINVASFGVDNELIARVHLQTQSLRLPIREFMWGSTRFDASVNAKQVRLFLSDLFGPSGAQLLDCRSVGDDPRAFEALFSQLMAANGTTQSSERTLRLLQMNLGDSASTRRCRTLWLVMGLFSQLASHSIYHVEIDGVPTEISWIVEYLQTVMTPHPELLVPDAHEEFASRSPRTVETWATLPRGQPVRLADSKDGSYSIESDYSELRVLRDDAHLSFVDVLVPGIGRGVVDRSNMLAIIEKPIQSWTFTSHPVRFLDLGLQTMSPEEIKGVLDLLSLVGASLERLKLTRWKFRGSGNIPSELDAQFFTSLERSCPRLRTLELNKVPIASAEALLELYARRSCTVTTVCLNGNCFVDQEELVRFVQAFASATSPISAAVDELTVSILPRESPEFDDEDEEEEEDIVVRVAQAVVDMLEVNQHLRRIHVRLPTEYLQDLTPYFLDHNDMPLQFRKQSLGIRHKCAFISTTPLQRNSPLDGATVSRIFAFAASTENRSVSVQAFFN